MSVTNKSTTLYRSYLNKLETEAETPEEKITIKI